MNNTIVEYINGMEVVKVFNRDGESYHRFETDVKNYRDFYSGLVPGLLAVDGSSTPAFCPAWRWCCCRPAAYLVLTGASTLPDYALVLCMSFSVGPASDPSYETLCRCCPS